MLTEHDQKFKIAIFDGFVYGLVARDILPAKIKAIPSELPLIWRNAE
ncbi:MAG: hypothetical protein IGNPGNKH_00604 [Sodalis sp. Ffu]|nr:MAG: hypothetical protein IGNPGNKH_00604 [Sodalis sp. Ffu]